MRGVIFSDHSVREILSGRKTVTRRVSPSWRTVKVGDLLWVREVCRVWQTSYPKSSAWEEDDDEAVSPTPRAELCVYRATPRKGRRRWLTPDPHQKDPHNMTFLVESTPLEVRPDLTRGPWKSPIYMPRWASRLTLRVESVSVERLAEMEALHGPEEAAREGAASVAEFLAAWDGMNPKAAVVHNPLVTRIAFAVVP